MASPPWNSKQRNKKNWGFQKKKKTIRKKQGTNANIPKNIPAILLRCVQRAVDAGHVGHTNRFKTATATITEEKKKRTIPSSFTIKELLGTR